MTDVRPPSGTVSDTGAVAASAPMTACAISVGNAVDACVRQLAECGGSLTALRFDRAFQAFLAHDPDPAVLRYDVLARGRTAEQVAAATAGGANAALLAAALADGTAFACAAPWGDPSLACEIVGDRAPLARRLDAPIAPVLVIDAAPDAWRDQHMLRALAVHARHRCVVLLSQDAPSDAVAAVRGALPDGVWWCGAAAGGVAHALQGLSATQRAALRAGGRVRWAGALLELAEASVKEDADAHEAERRVVEASLETIAASRGADPRAAHADGPRIELVERMRRARNAVGSAFVADGALLMPVLPRLTAAADACGAADVRTVDGRLQLTEAKERELSTIAKECIATEAMAVAQRVEARARAAAAEWARDVAGDAGATFDPKVRALEAQTITDLIERVVMVPPSAPRVTDVGRPINVTLKHLYIVVSAYVGAWAIADPLKDQIGSWFGVLLKLPIDHKPAAVMVLAALVAGHLFWSSRRAERSLERAHGAAASNLAKVYVEQVRRLATGVANELDRSINDYVGATADDVWHQYRTAIGRSRDDLDTRLALEVRALTDRKGRCADMLHHLGTLATAVAAARTTAGTCAGSLAALAALPEQP